MKMEEIRAIANTKGLTPGRMKKADLIHVIQNSEGNNPCFGTGMIDFCGQTNCLWRSDCS